MSLRQYIDARGYGEDMFQHYLVPMSSAVWSTPPEKMEAFPALTLLRFWHNHGFLGLSTQHQWWTVSGGSQSYVRKITAPFAGRVHRNRAVTRVSRTPNSATLHFNDGPPEVFDKVILACHGDQALALLADPTGQENRLLSRFLYQPNTATLHTDPSLMPRTPRCWAAWNYRLDSGPNGEILPTTHYWMNRLQRVSDKENYFVSLNCHDRIDPARSNIAGMASDFWHNGMWHHSDVAGAIFETVLMAFLGTVGAAIVALPLAFVAARNMNPLGPLRFALRRVFDFTRGVDGLIWTIILSRAFGPGPMTGALAILITDTGSFGKLFSEALENIDEKQVEGVRSTGANALQRARFGVIPQVTPVLLSQVLYYLESNTRSATVIGAIVGGGIGLLLTQAIITQKDWEEVAYYITLIILMVMTMDSLSGWLRRKLIKGE